MSNPTLAPASTCSLPVWASSPLLAGDWTTTVSFIVSMSNRVVAVLASRSLLVYPTGDSRTRGTLGLSRNLAADQRKRLWLVMGVRGRRSALCGPDVAPAWPYP